jgi:hypothetical protein
MMHLAVRASLQRKPDGLFWMRFRTNSGLPVFRITITIKRR